MKYIVPVKKVDSIIKDLDKLKFACPDDHGGREGYRVISLYYDSPDLDFFWDKIEGIKFRRKLRIRIYPVDGVANVTHGMVEIKQRINRTVQKKRVYIPLETAEQLCAGTIKDEHIATGFFDDIDPFDRQVISEIQYMVRAKHLRPTCITDYHRQAYMGGLYNPGLRITFDTDVRARTHGLKVNHNVESHLFLPSDWCIMEVKVNDAIPDWVSSLLARHGCQIQRVSKYCTGLAKAKGIKVLPLAIYPVPGMEVG